MCIRDSRKVNLNQWQLNVTRMVGHGKLVDGSLGKALLTTPCKDPGDYCRVDPSLLFDGALEARWEELNHLGLPRRHRRAVNTHIQKPLQWARETLSEIEGDIVQLHRDFGPPLPYYALLEADGDGIGAALNHLTLDGLGVAVQALYDFADGAWEIVERHHGAAYYVGGDELMAWLPVDKALDAAIQLATLFDDTTRNVRWDLDGRRRRPALSVGITIAHVKEDLREVRRGAHEALQRAKQERRANSTNGNWTPSPGFPGSGTSSSAPSSPDGGLCIYDDPAGGAVRSSVGRIAGLVKQLEALSASRVDQELSLSTAHELLELVQRYKPDTPDTASTRAWTQDPQGIYFGGNEMSMTPRQMVSFGELYLNDGRVGATQVLPEDWIAKTRVPRGRSRWGSDREYGYGFWIRDLAGHDSYYAWGYGGQFIFIVPDLHLVVVTTSRTDVSTERRDHLGAIYDLVEQQIIPSLEIP